MEAFWIAFAFLFGLGVRHIGLPALIGYLVAGFVLNACGLQGGEVLAHVAHLGMLLLLFSVGLKLRLQTVLQPEVWGSTLLHLAITGLVLSLALHTFGGVPWRIAFVLASALGFSSTVVAAKVLEEKRELRSFHGRVAIGILIVQDLAAVGLLSVSSGQVPSPWILGLLSLPLLRPLIHRMLDISGHDELFLLYGLLLALVVGGVGFKNVGLSPELGALLLGALLARHRRAVELSHALWGVKEVFLVGFFLQIGMSGLPTWEAFGFATLLGVLLPLKAVLFFFLLLRFKLRARSAFLASLSLASYSEFGLIIVQSAAQRGWLSADWLVLLALTVAVSFVIAAPLNHFAHVLYERLEPRLLPFEVDQRHPDEQPLSLDGARILILGMGRVGTGAYDFFAQRGESVVGLDSDPIKVERQQHQGRRVLYGDVEDPGLWHGLNLTGVGAVLLAMPDIEAKRFTVSQLRRRGYSGLVSATTAYPEETTAIIADGANVAFNYYDEVGVGFAEHVWETLYPDTTAARSQQTGRV